MLQLLLMMLNDADHIGRSYQRPSLGCWLNCSTPWEPLHFWILRWRRHWPHL